MARVKIGSQRLRFLSQLDALLRDFAEFLRQTREIDDFDRKKGWGFFELVKDCRESRMRHRSRPLDTDVDIRALGSRPSRAGAEQKYAIDRVGEVPPYPGLLA